MFNTLSQTLKHTAAVATLGLLSHAALAQPPAMAVPDPRPAATRTTCSTSAWVSTSTCPRRMCRTSGTSTKAPTPSRCGRTTSITLRDCCSDREQVGIAAYY